MSAYLYDKVLVDKLQEITGDSRIRIVPPEMSIQFLAQIDKDKVDYPAIVLTRNSVKINGELKNQVAYLRGETAKIQPDNIVVKAKSLPVQINWTVDVYAVDRYTCDEIVRELVFYFITYPRFNVKVPYGIDIEQNFDILIEDDIIDNSDLVNFPNKGELFRESFVLYTENAHFYSSGKIYPTVNVYDKEINIK